MLFPIQILDTQMIKPITNIGEHQHPQKHSQNDPCSENEDPPIRHPFHMNYFFHENPEAVRCLPMCLYRRLQKAPG